MITAEILSNIIHENSFSLRNKTLISRENLKTLDENRIVVISGIRRCGKSTLLKQLVQDRKNKLFINFEDTRLENFEISDFQKIEDLAKAKNIDCYIFDEIQNIEGWEKYVRSAFEKGFKIYITGSNASMLSRELGTRLTGRYIQKELFPFNYNEYLDYTKSKAGEASQKLFLTTGGFPEYLAIKDPEYLRTLFRDIIIRDIVVRRGIKNEHTILRLALHLISNVGKEVSFNNLSKNVEIKSVRTAIDYADYLKESYLLDFIPRFSYSIKQQQINPKKVYAIDLGMARANSLSFSEDNGRILENAVFLRLRQFTHDIMYYKDDQSECDFLVRRNEKIIYAVQVCTHLTPDNLKREILGVQNAIKATGIDKGVIITINQDDNFDNIQVIPFWKWMQIEMLLEKINE